MLANLFILAKLFFGSAVAEDAMRCFGSVRTVTAGSVIAAHSAAFRHAGNNGGVPIAVISRAPKGAPIIVTGSASTVVAGESEPA
jgi:Fe2+ transport system protein FeoA